MTPNLMSMMGLPDAQSTQPARNLGPMQPLVDAALKNKALQDGIGRGVQDPSGAMRMGVDTQRQKLEEHRKDIEKNAAVVPQVVKWYNDKIKKVSSAVTDRINDLLVAKKENLDTSNIEKSIAALKQERDSLQDKLTQYKATGQVDNPAAQVDKQKQETTHDKDVKKRKEELAPVESAIPKLREAAMGMNYSMPETVKNLFITSRDAPELAAKMSQLDVEDLQEVMRHKLITTAARDAMSMYVVKDFETTAYNAQTGMLDNLAAAKKKYPVEKLAQFLGEPGPYDNNMDGMRLAKTMHSVLDDVQAALQDTASLPPEKQGISGNAAGIKGVGIFLNSMSGSRARFIPLTNLVACGGDKKTAVELHNWLTGDPSGVTLKQYPRLEKCLAEGTKM